MSAESELIKAVRELAELEAAQQTFNKVVARAQRKVTRKQEALGQDDSELEDDGE